MELISVQRARSMWFFDSYELNPRGKDIGSDLLDWLKDAYQFTKSPSSPSDLDETKGLVFTGGQFQAREEIFLAIELRIYNDGVIADTRSSTDDTDLFLADVFQSAAKEFSLPYRHEIIRKKMYVSELNVRTDRKLTTINPRLTEFASKLSELQGMRSLPGTTSLVELCGLSFWADGAPNPTVQSFRFERKHGTGFSEDRYYSIAPLRTTNHLKMLEDLETILCAE